MATQSIEQLKARVEALGLELIEDCDTHCADGPGIYVLDPQQHRLVWLGMEGGQTALDNLEPWIADRETSEQSEEAQPEPTSSERRATIAESGDVDAAINHTLGALYAILGQGRMLQQDTLRDEGAWVLSIAHMIVEESERMIEFLDRRGGWSKGGAA